MIRRVAVFCVAALVVLQISRGVAGHVGARNVDPLQVTESSAVFSKSTGQSVLYANLIVPRSDSIEGSTLIYAIGDASVLLTFNNKGMAKTAGVSASLRLGKPTCQCPDGSHQAKLVVSVKGSKVKKSVLMQSSGSTPTVANVQLGFESESLEFEAPLMVRK
ncbi:MAG TPA: hypothetical protein VKX17_26645 [Planctomycetota bacterium]|nr:hypothetical protein [Planctomycetota bacterium]